MNARKSPRIFSMLAVAGLLVACGDGGSSATVFQPTASITYLQDAGLVVGAPTPPLNPTVAGRVTGDFMISPPLPPGLTIEPGLGIIYGVPTAPAPTTIYTVTAASEEGRIKTTVRFTVRDVTPRISYNPNSWNLTQNTPLPGNITPSNAGGVVVIWSIDRALPAGLTFDTSNGTISGTPTTSSSQTDYLVSATNSGGSSSATLTITVQAASGLNGAKINAVVHTAAGDFFGVAGKTAIVQSGGWLMVSGSGVPLANIEMPASTGWWQLAADGSYVVTATDRQLTAWSTTGAVLFTRKANYLDSSVFAAAGELRIGAGPAGDHVIETIAVPTGLARLSLPIPGTFLAWNEDGEGFAARTGVEVTRYARDALLGYVELPGGRGMPR